MAELRRTFTQKAGGVVTNVITGFLGVGKSTAVLHLLRQKPKTERWAVLVNQFGEVGVDGSLIEGQTAEEQGVFIREVPGGCMCCAAGVPVQVALTTLLSRGRPDRLLIEPTGLGHPQEVLALLNSEHYRRVLDLRRRVDLRRGEAALRPCGNPRGTRQGRFHHGPRCRRLQHGRRLLTKSPLTESPDSRVEIISSSAATFADLEEALLSCATLR